MHLLSTQCYVIKYTKLVAVYYHQLTLFFVLPKERKFILAALSLHTVHSEVKSGSHRIIF